MGVGNWRRQSQIKQCNILEIPFTRKERGARQRPYHRFLIDGVTKFEKYGPDRKKVSIYPREVQPQNPNSYRARKRESFRMRREHKKARVERAILESQLVLASADDAENTNQVC